jgi:hypothetical protein
VLLGNDRPVEPPGPAHALLECLEVKHYDACGALSVARGDRLGDGYVGVVGLVNATSLLYPGPGWCPASLSRAALSSLPLIAAANPIH